MTAERWQQVKELFNAACDCGPERRAAFLDDACAGDVELRKEVESLLAAHEELGQFMRGPLATVAQPDAAPTAALESGRQIGPYQIERRLGAGGIGVVYLARDTRLGRSIALKLLKARFTHDDEHMRRFQQEARAVSALNHPNIITIYEIGQDSGLRFIVTEFVDGQTLRELFVAGGMRLGEALDLLIQVTGALSAAHEAGVVHRDLKPENIMARRDGIVKVLDFGLAKLTEQEGQPPGDDVPRVNTRPGIIMGTVNYMSPEQARGWEVDARSDLFSLGVVMYEMITGREPFVAATTTGVLASLLSDEPPPLSHSVPGLPAAFQRIVDRALAKSVGRRYQTAREMGDDLRRLKQELEFAARLPALAARHEDAIAMKIGAAAQSASSYSTFIDGQPVVDQATRNVGRSTNDHAARDSGRPAVDYDTRADAKAAGRTTAQMAAMIMSLRRRGKAILLASAALAMVVVGLILGWRWKASQNEVMESIAVLPFANVGGDPQMEYLPDGITESLIDSLSRLTELRVIARSTVFSYKGREVDPRQVGQTLNVRAVVTGRVSRQGERLIIRAELVDAADGARLWGDEYQRPLADILALQDEIARQISAKLRLRLDDAGQRQMARRYTADAEAYQLYIKGRHHFLRFDRANLEKALEYFQQALARDPQYALAHAGVADVYNDLSSQYLPPSEALPKARQAALRAVAIDDRLAEAHHSLAVVKWLGDWDWVGAEAQFKRALELNPNAATTYAFYSDFLQRLRRFDEALALARRGEELDPISAFVSTTVCVSRYRLRQYDQAIAQCRKTLELDPNYFYARDVIALCLMQQGRYEESIVELRRALEINRHDVLLATLGYVYAVAGRRDEARRMLAELEEQGKKRRVSLVYPARIYAGLGEKDRALALLRRTYDERSDHALSLGVSTFFDNLRSDPRYIELLRGVGLAPER